MSVKMASNQVTFPASDLYSKFGFEDGDKLHDFAWRFGIRRFKHELLREIVMHFLLPVLPAPVELYTLSTCHNPVRVVDDGFTWDETYNENAGTFVRMDWHEIEMFAMEKGYLWPPMN